MIRLAVFCTLFSFLLNACSEDSSPESTTQIAFDTATRKVRLAASATLELPLDFVLLNEEEDCVDFARVSREEYVDACFVPAADTGKEELEAFANEALSELTARYETLKQSAWKELVIHERRTKAIAVDVKDLVSGRNWSYWLAFYEADSGFHAVNIRCPQQRKLYFEKTAQAILLGWRSVQKS